jgi:hypothetical protein
MRKSPPKVRDAGTGVDEALALLCGLEHQARILTNTWRLTHSCSARLSHSSTWYRTRTYILGYDIRNPLTRLSTLTFLECPKYLPCTGRGVRLPHLVVHHHDTELDLSSSFSPPLHMRQPLSAFRLAGQGWNLCPGHLRHPPCIVLF